MNVWPLWALLRVPVTVVTSTAVPVPSMAGDALATYVRDGGEALLPSSQPFSSAVSRH